MRSLRCLLVLGAALLAVPATASAADVNVGDDFFSPRTVQINPGETVNWIWTGVRPHNVKTDPGQSESFDSPILTGPGNTFQHTFANAGRFTYFCEVHGQAMSGVVQVGAPDTVDPVVRRLRARAGETGVRLTFRLSEESRVRLKLSGPSDRNVVKRLRSGRRSVRFRRLSPGRYKATVRPTDLSGNRGAAVTKRFRVG